MQPWQLMKPNEKTLSSLALYPLHLRKTVITWYQHTFDLIIFLKFSKYHSTLAEYAKSKVSGTFKYHSGHIQVTFKTHSGYIQETFRTDSISVETTFIIHSNSDSNFILYSVRCKKSWTFTSVEDLDVGI